MKSLIGGLLLLALTYGTANGELGIPSYANKHEYMTTVPDEAFENSPAWKPNEPNPPLSARRALELANSLADKIEPSTAEARRELQALELCPHRDKWYWRAYYQWHPTVGGMTGIAPDLTIVVMMDGTVIEPKQTKKKLDP